MHFIELEQAWAQWIFLGLLTSAISTALFFFLLYLTIRYAIRDGLRDAQRLERRGTATRERDRISGPEIRAD